MLKRPPAACLLLKPDIVGTNRNDSQSVVPNTINATVSVDLSLFKPLPFCTYIEIRPRIQQGDRSSKCSPIFSSVDRGRQSFVLHTELFAREHLRSLFPPPFPHPTFRALLYRFRNSSDSLIHQKTENNPKSNSLF
ncbi:hypothetical protein PAXRUDRAFT_644859 [Paxillus rubicundulus Ve08.2h10]|uniref:Unplaced genomic scaffold scaffold_6, whole genome shotgun sequence n=1 Tax=Paxillus rubicundulus Ve08.2h10 TaxID=930991 RepID=A0A0D0DY97_9AGAM|nr:hypothetical protein PAXRUDRAFT_644859 [Paxillus rubicundulus Ve08.2h10]